METRKFRIATAQSNIDWTGRKITGSHNGTIAIKEGTLTLKDGKLTGGRFIIDTTSIRILDIADLATNAQFAGHLASDDFFASEQFPEALFVITSVKQSENDTYDINGELTIKGITNPAWFNALLNVSGDTLTASGKIIIDRTLYGIKFRSGNFFKDLGDNLIYNDFELDVNITATATDQQARTEIKEALEKYYFTGIYEGNLDLLNKVYNAGTLLFGDVKGQPYSKTLDQYLDAVKNRQSPKDSGKPFKGEIVSVELINSIAVAEVTIKMYDFNYQEFLSFHKLDGRWLIVNKMISDVNN
jgi:polyisoprenoid-binding protein YceI